MVFQVNIFLRITGKRADGYHDLASLFHVSNFSQMFLAPIQSNIVVVFGCWFRSESEDPDPSCFFSCSNCNHIFCSLI